MFAFHSQSSSLYFFISLEGSLKISFHYGHMFGGVNVLISSKCILFSCISCSARICPIPLLHWKNWTIHHDIQPKPPRRITLFIIIFPLPRIRVFMPLSVHWKPYRIQHLVGLWCACACGSPTPPSFRAETKSKKTEAATSWQQKCSELEHNRCPPLSFKTNKTIAFQPTKLEYERWNEICTGASAGVVDGGEYYFVRFHFIE